MGEYLLHQYIREVRRKCDIHDARLQLAHSFIDWRAPQPVLRAQHVVAQGIW